MTCALVFLIGSIVVVGKRRKTAEKMVLAQDNDNFYEVPMEVITRGRAVEPEVSIDVINRGRAMVPDEYAQPNQMYDIATQRSFLDSHADSTTDTLPEFYETYVP